MTASIFFSTAALVVAIGTAWYTHRSANQRELRSWRRSELLTATATLLQLSTARQAVLDNAADALSGMRPGVDSDPFDTERSGGPHPRHCVDQMQGIVERIKLVDPGVAGAADDLVIAHLNAQLAADSSSVGESDPYRHVETMMVAPKTLASLHSNLAEAYRAAAR